MILPRQAASRGASRSQRAAFSRGRWSRGSLILRKNIHQDGYVFPCAARYRMASSFPPQLACLSRFSSALISTEGAPCQVTARRQDAGTSCGYWDACSRSPLVTILPSRPLDGRWTSSSCFLNLAAGLGQFAFRRWFAFCGFLLDRLERFDPSRALCVDRRPAGRSKRPAWRVFPARRWVCPPEPRGGCGRKWHPSRVGRGYPRQIRPRSSTSIRAG